MSSGRRRDAARRLLAGRRLVALRATALRATAPVVVVAAAHHHHQPGRRAGEGYGRRRSRLVDVIPHPVGEPHAEHGAAELREVAVGLDHRRAEQPAGHDLIGAVRLRRRLARHDERPLRPRRVAVGQRQRDVEADERDGLVARAAVLRSRLDDVGRVGGHEGERQRRLVEGVPVDVDAGLRRGEGEARVRPGRQRELRQVPEEHGVVAVGEDAPVLGLRDGQALGGADELLSLDQARQQRRGHRQPERR
jgi:hypothetical protein